MNMQSTCLIRPAGQEDAAALAKLIDIAGEGIPSWFWRQQCTKGQTPLDIGTNRAQRATGGFSYKNALIAETNGTPLGMVLSYAIYDAPTDEPDDLPDPIAPFVALEKLSVETWYINALAVFPEHQGKGIGAELMTAAENRARTEGLDAVSIQVYGQNAGAARLYRRLGYAQTATSPVRSHPCPPYYTGDVLLLMKAL